MFLNGYPIRSLLFVCGLLALSLPAGAQDIADIISQFAGGDTESTAKPASQSPLDLLGSESVATKLQLNNEQREKVKSIAADFQKQADAIKQTYDDRLKAITSLGEKLRKRAQFRGEVRTQTNEIRTKAENSLLELLNEQQKAQLKTLVPDKSGDTQSSETSSTRSETSGSTKTSRPTASPAQAPARRTEDTVASFGGNGVSATPAPQDSAPQDNAPPATPESVDGESTAQTGNAAGTAQLTFNFHEAPWTDVLKLFAKAAGLTLNIRDVPPGSFTYYDRKNYTPVAALDVMNRMLMQNGYILVRHDRFLSVFDANKGVPPNLVETVTPADLSRRGETELLRVALPLGDRDTAKAAEEVRALLGPQGKVAPLESANSIVVTDIAANLIRVQELLQPPPKLGDDKLTFKAFALNQIDASEAAEIIRSLLGVQTGVSNVSAGQPSSSRSSSRRGFDPREFFSRMRGGDSSSRSSSSRSSSSSSNRTTQTNANAKVAVDFRTNSVLVNATAGNMKLVEQMIEAIDVEPKNAEGLAGGRNSRDPYLEVYKLKTADASEVAKTLGVLHPGMVVNEDGRNKMLHIWANSEKHKEISAHIRQLDGATAGSTLAVLSLGGLNGYDVVSTVDALYKTQPEQAPSVQIDPSGRSLVVRGDASQIQLVQTMIDRLAEQGPYESSGRTIRVVGSGVASSEFMQQTIGALYPQVTFTPAAPTSSNNDKSSRDSRSSRDKSGRSSSSNNSDSDRTQRIMEWRQRFFGGFGRGDSSGSRSSGSSRDSSSRSRSGRGR